MTTVGILGSGNIGSTVARLAVDGGHEVVLSNSRRPGTLASLAAERGPGARAAAPEEAAAAGELVLVSVPLKAYLSLSGLPLAGKPHTRPEAAEGYPGSPEELSRSKVVIPREAVAEVLVRLARTAAALGKVPRQGGPTAEAYTEAHKALDQLGRLPEIGYCR